VIPFAALDQKVVRRVVDKFMAQLEAQLSDRNVTFSLTDGARAWLAREGYDALFGARPLARVVQEHIKKPLADELLFGKLAKGGHVKVLIRAKKLDFEITPEGKSVGKSVGKSGGKSDGKPGGKSGGKGGAKKEPEQVK